MWWFISLRKNCCRNIRKLVRVDLKDKQILCKAQFRTWKQHHNGFKSTMKQHSYSCFMRKYVWTIALGTYLYEIMEIEESFNKKLYIWKSKCSYRIDLNPFWTWKHIVRYHFFLFIANSILTCPCALLIAILPSHVVPITTCTLYYYLAWEWIKWWQLWSFHILYQKNSDSFFSDPILIVMVI